MFIEILEVPGEIFEVCPHTGMPLFPGQDPLTDEEIAEFFSDSTN